MAAVIDSVTAIDITDYDSVVNHPGVEVADSNDSVELLHYKGGDPESDLYDVRGLIYDTESHTLVARSAPYLPNLTVDELPEDKSFTVSKAEEGTIIRLFYYKGKYYCSTHHRLDASGSYWGSRYSFGEIFGMCLASMCVEGDLLDHYPELSQCVTPMDYVARFHESLQKEWSSGKTPIGVTHTFLVSHHTVSRIVCQSTTPRVMYTGSYLVDGRKFMLDLHLPTPNTTSGIPVDQIREMLRNLDPMRYQGLIVSCKTKSVKLIHPVYEKLAKLRGTQPNIRYRYIELLHERDSDRVRQFRELFPEYESVFTQVDTELRTLCDHVYALYEMRFINKYFVQFPRDCGTEIHLTRDLHAWFTEDRRFRRVSPAVVYTTVLKMDPKLITRLLTNQKKGLYDPMNGRIKIDKLRVM